MILGSLGSVTGAPFLFLLEAQFFSGGEIPRQTIAGTGMSERRACFH